MCTNHKSKILFPVKMVRWFQLKESTVKTSIKFSNKVGTRRLKLTGQTGKDAEAVATGCQSSQT